MQSDTAPSAQGKTPTLSSGGRGRVDAGSGRCVLCPVPHWQYKRHPPIGKVPGASFLAWNVSRRPAAILAQANSYVCRACKKVNMIEDTADNTIHNATYDDGRTSSRCCTLRSRICETQRNLYEICTKLVTKNKRNCETRNFSRMKFTPLTFIP